jgi:hypothetical protein
LSAARLALSAPDHADLMPNRAAEHIATLASILPFSLTITHINMVFSYPFSQKFF